MPFATVAGATPQPFDLATLDRNGAEQIVTEIAAGVDPGLAPEDVIFGAASLPFAAAYGSAPQFPSDGRDVWIRFALTNSAAEPQSAKFVIHFSYLERADLFEILPGGDLRRSTAGSAVPVSGAAVATAYPTFQMILAPGETRDYYVRVRSDSILFFPMRIISESRFSHALTRDTMIWSLIAGTAFVFSIYAASMSFGAAGGTYRAFFCFSLSAAAYTLISSGLMSALAGSGLAINLNRLIYSSQACVFVFGILFIVRFLDLRHVAPRLYTLLIVFALVPTLTGVNFILPDWLAALSQLVATGIGPLLLICGLGWLAMRGVPGAATAMVAWTPSLLAAVWMYLRLVNVSPYLPVNHFIVSLSFVFTLAHLSLMLGARAKEAERWANNDILTGLGNRRLLTTVAAEEAREPSARYAAALAIDLDNFKPVNDRHGHAAGDAVLVAVGERLRSIFKGKGDVFRLGGDEFLVLAYSTASRLEIVNLAGDYLQANRLPIQFEGNLICIDASIGIAFMDDHGDVDAMLKRADEELYAVKQAGRGMVRIADQRKQERRRPRRTMNLLMMYNTFFARTGDPSPLAANDETGPPERLKV